MRVHGTPKDDRIKITKGDDSVNAGKGDDHIFLFTAMPEIMVNGGDGYDTFEFHVSASSSYSIERDLGHTVITIDSPEMHREIVLIDVEEIIVHEMNF